KFSPMTWDRNEQHPITNKVNIIVAVDNSLKRLKTDYIDLYQFHCPTNRPHYHFGNWWDFEPLVGKQNKQRIVDNIHEN
ncbi:aldo/keto reductase, partial [Francisella tularensis]|uniref:aldo/keto reductase n=1 Tax=Francisella tularensis TaxID=263 RepID=UPI002381A78A